MNSITQVDCAECEENGDQTLEKLSHHRVSGIGRGHLLVNQESEIVTEYQQASLATSWLCIQHEYSLCAD